MNFLKFYLNGNQITLLPDGYKGIDLQLSFEDSSQPRLSIEQFDFRNLVDVPATENPYSIIKDWVEGGKNGTTGGIAEGIPFLITYECGNSITTIFDGVLDLSSENTSFSCDRIIAPARERKGQDYLNDKVNSFRFEYLARSIPSGSPGHISPSDYIQVWYQDGRYPRKVEIMIAFLTLVFLIKETIELIKRIVDVTSAVVGGVTGGAEAALQIAALLVYLVAVVITMVDLLKELINLIFPFVYYHNAMYAKDLCKKACDYLGLGFSSTILENDLSEMYILPTKNVEGVKVGNINNEPGYYHGSFGQLLLDLQTKNAGKPKVIGGVLYYETEEWYQNNAVYDIPDMYYDFTGTNASEWVKTTNLNYANDPIDLFSYESYVGQSTTATTDVTSAVNDENVTLKDLDNRQIPFVLPNIKTKTSRLEEVMTRVFNSYAGLINAVSSVMSPSSTTPIPAIPSNQLNILNIDSHFVSVPKIGIQPTGDTGRTSPTSINVLGSRKMYENYVSQSSIKGVFGHSPNQWETFEGFQIPMCCEDFIVLKDNNYAKYLGSDAKITSLIYNPYDGVAEIKFKKREVFVSNLSVELVFDGGNSGTLTI